MGYRISYESGGEKQPILDKRVFIKRKKLLWSILIVSVFTLSILLQNKSIKQSILPGNKVITEAAIKNFAYSVRSGQDLGDAVTAFCRHIIDHADS